MHVWVGLWVKYLEVELVGQRVFSFFIFRREQTLKMSEGCLDKVLYVLN